MMARLLVRMLQVGMLGTNCFILADDTTREGYVIDPGGDASRITAAARDIHFRCLGILCTHGHVDHVGAAGKIAEATGAPVLISREDSGALTGSAHGLAGRIGSMVVSRPRGGVDFIGEPDVLEFAGHRLQVLATPGHTPGSLSFLCGSDLFCGDLVFEGSVGRTDLRGGSFARLLDSVRRHVFTLPDDTRIFPGHGPATTVGRERAGNPFLREIGGGG